ncbi:beta-glucosidase [Paraburkholderia sp. SIMBA_030]|uniref:beta-glucosidase n=1 Tax=Paraburkholderia sp. SIMBA_030 TaxID=3085773 RepID=UPI00397C6F52
MFQQMYLCSSNPRRYFHQRFNEDDCMPTIPLSRSLLKSRIFRRAILCTLLLLTFSSASYAQFRMRMVNPPGSLIMHVSAKKILHFYVSLPDDLHEGKLTVNVFPYDSDGKPTRAPLATYRKTISSAQSGSVIDVGFTLSRAGLFRVDATLASQDGETLDQTSSTLAVVTRRDDVGPSDAGVVTHFAQGGAAPSVLLPLVKQAGFSWIRDELYWEAIEKRPGVFDFPRRFNTYLAASARLGISPLVVLDYGNATAYPAMFSKSNFPQSPEARKRFVDYVRAVVGRYRATVKNWELWNEPDFGKISYASYSALLKDTFRAIKQISPDANVISCGGGGSGGGPGGDCLVGVMNQGGLNDQDGFSVHPYMSPNTPEKGYKATGAPIDSVSIPTVWPYLGRLAADHVKADGRTLQIWVTETGWPLTRKVPGQDEAGQASNLVRTYLLSRRYGEVRVVFWYDFVDDGTDIDNIEHNFGLLHHDLTPKPAFVAASVLNTTVGKRGWGKALVDAENVKAYRYGTDDPVIVGWTVDGKENTASISVPPGKYIQRDWQGVDTPLTISAQSFDWRVGPLPRYLIPDRR